MQMREPLLQLREATVLRGGVPILDRVTLTVAAGEHTAILGPNGSGKSTLIKLLTCQIYPVVGRATEPPIRIFGRDRWNVSELRSRLGIVSSDMHQRLVTGSSMGRLIGRDAVIASFFASETLFLHHEVTPEMIDRAEIALEMVKGSELAEKRMNEMSTGEVRRVLIARALVHEPEVLVLDEPTTGLDLVARRDFLSQIQDLAAAGKTLILVTHHIEEIIPEIQRIVLLDQGRIAADGSPSTVLTRPMLSRVFGSPIEVSRSGSGYEMRLASHETRFELSQEAQG